MRARDYGKNQDASYTDLDTGEIFDKFPMPNSNYRNNVLEKISHIFVSRMPKRSIDGKVHNAKIRSTKYMDNPKPEYNNSAKFSTINKPLTISGIKIGGNDEIIGLCPTYKHNNINIYNLLYERLKQHDSDCKKAFSEPLFAPRKNGSQSDTQIKSIKIIKPQNTGVKVNNGIADNGRMIRIDIFNKNEKNYIIPIYISDTIKKNLPNKAIIAHKHEDNWVLIDNTFNFLFSLYPNDLLKIKDKNKEEVFGYYIKTDRSNDSITIKHHDGSTDISKGVKKAILEKYSVDVLGNITQVKEKTRQPFYHNRARNDIP